MIVDYKRLPIAVISASILFQSRVVGAENI